MENKKFLFLTVLFIFIFNSFLFGQEELQEIEEPSTQWQILEWEDNNSEYVSKYEILIEVYNEKIKNYEELQLITTEKNDTSIAINPQLPAGIYRYKITSYDLLGFEGAESDWYDLKIYQAYEPRIRSINANSSKTSTIYLEEINDGILNISGRNLFDLQKTPEDISFTSYFFVSKNDSDSKRVYYPEILEHNGNNRDLKVYIDLSQLDVGKYNFVAKDASGLESEKDTDSEISIRFKKLMDLDLAAGYVLPVTVFDETMKEYFKTPVRPLSFTGKLTFIPFKRMWGYLGIGVQGTYSRLLAKYEAHTIDGNMMTAMANLVYQKPINIMSKDGTKNRHLLTLEAHAGGGAIILQDVTFHFPKNIDSDSLNTYSIGIDAGVGVQFYFTNRIYLETGADFIYGFMNDMQLGQILPFVCAGFQF